MSKAGEKLIEAAQSGIGRTCFLNPFTGKTEEWLYKEHAERRMFEEAANRIKELQDEVERIKAFLVI